MATEDRWHDFAKEKPSEDMEGRDFIVSNGYSDTLSMWCGGYWENEPFMGNKLCDEVVRWKGYLTPEEEKANEATRTELKADKTFVFGEECEAYKKSDVDELLAEKDEEIDKQKWRGDEWAKACNQKEKEIESLKASHYAEMVDAGMRERRLRRALWIARAELCHRLDVDRYLRNHRNSWYNENFLTWADACVAMEVKMCKAETKCRAKAESYL